MRSISIENTITNLDDLPEKTFGLLGEVSSSIRPVAEIPSWLYVCYGIHTQPDLRALIFFRYGDTQAWINTRNRDGWHGWKPLINNHGQCSTGSYMGLNVTAYYFGKVVFVVLSGTTTKAIAISEWYNNNGSIASNLPKPITDFWHQSRVGGTAEKYSILVTGNDLNLIARDAISSGTTIVTSFTYIAE